jgi:hypothetical protein
LAQLGDDIRLIEQRAAAQASSERAWREGTAKRDEARKGLREPMQAISQTARAMDADAPGLKDKFKMPRPNASDVVMLNTARAFATNALPLKAEFIRFELPADFLEQLNARIESFEQAIDSQQRSKREQAAATAGLEEAVERSVNTVRMLDAIVRNKFRDNPSALAEWESASRVARPRASKPNKPEGPNTPLTT